MYTVLKYVLGFIVVAILVMGFFVTNGLSEIKAMSIGRVDLSTLRDGVYSGSFTKNRWLYSVSVTVKDHKIVDIKLTDDKMKGSDKVNSEQIKRVIDNQSLGVDVVSGATVNSKALLKAIETALKSQPR